MPKIIPLHTKYIKNMTRNIILGDCLDELPKIASETIDLVIADPPYWKVIGEKWDYEWRTEKDYYNGLKKLQEPFAKAALSTFSVIFGRWQL